MTLVKVTWKPALAANGTTERLAMRFLRVGQRRNLYKWEVTTPDPTLGACADWHFFLILALVGWQRVKCPNGK